MDYEFEIKEALERIADAFDGGSEGDALIVAVLPEVNGWCQVWAMKGDRLLRCPIIGWAVYATGITHSITVTCDGCEVDDYGGSGLLGYDQKKPGETDRDGDWENEYTQWAARQAGK